MVDGRWFNTADGRWFNTNDGRWVDTQNNFMRSMGVGIEYETILEDVTPNDNVDLNTIGILYIGTFGDVKVTGVKGGTVTLKNVPSGTWLNFIRVIRVFENGTT